MSPIARRMLKAVFLAGCTLVIMAIGAWGAFAAYYQLPANETLRMAASAVWAAVSVAAIVALYRRRSGAVLAGYGTVLVLLVGWWMSIVPSNERNWADDVAQMARGTIDGSRITMDNVRNFDWRSETDYTARWDTRTYDLDTVSSLDLLLSYWSSPAIAHTLVSFGFDNGTHVVFSVEIRKEKHERFSELGGFFKQFETSVIAADERDIVRLRTNVRGEDVYLYRIAMPKQAMRSLFLAYVEKANSLKTDPEFYHTVTANCTTIVYDMVQRIVPGLPLDYRLLFSGYLPDYIETVGGFTPGYSLQQLREAGRVTDRARAADRSADFSRRIRIGVPTPWQKPQPL